jgi:hypothetical protein
LVAYGGLLRVDPLHLFGKRDPTGRHVFECATGLVPAPRGLWPRPLSVDTCPHVATYKANTGQTTPFRKNEDTFFG